MQDCKYSLLFAISLTTMTEIPLQLFLLDVTQTVDSDLLQV